MEREKKKQATNRNPFRLLRRILKLATFINLYSLGLCWALYFFLARSLFISLLFICITILKTTYLKEFVSHFTKTTSTNKNSNHCSCKPLGEWITSTHATKINLRTKKHTYTNYKQFNVVFFLFLFISFLFCELNHYVLLYFVVRRLNACCAQCN